ncbi:aftiphilin-like isoform X2 [Heptranchias perlo]|uniref:aftiphilin-like isoform X2 n=1 Tax=Heptranchias perlo TaxID=212740 RepID=UPI00355AB28E
MEPDVIRLYSSSPPPLDDGTEIDEDDEFGEFGGFSGVGASTLGYTDFDLEDHRENFMPQNHFVPGHEYSSDTDGFADFHSAGASEGKDFLSDFSRPAEGMSNDMPISIDKDVTRSKSSKSVFDCTTESIKQTEVTGTLDSLTKDVSTIDLEPEEQCNGSKTNPEILTNGYPTIDSTHSQGIETMDNTSDQKGQKATNAHISELCSDSMPSPIEDFAEFSAFSNVEVSANLTEEKTIRSLPTISEVPLKAERNAGNHSALGKLPDIQVSSKVIVDSDKLTAVREPTEGKFAASNCKNGNDTHTHADVDHTHSEFSTAVDTSIPNSDWNSSESMEHIETKDQNAQQSVHESLDIVKEISTTESTAIRLDTDLSESKKQEILEPDLETCISDEEGLGVFTDSVVCRESTVEQEHAVIEELPATDMKRTEENDSDHFGISRSNCSPDSDFSTFSPVLYSNATDDFGTVDVHPIDSDSKTASKLTTEVFATFQEPGVKDEFGDFSNVSADSPQTFANFSESLAVKEVVPELLVHEGDMRFGEHGTGTTAAKTDDEDFGEFGSIQQAKNGAEFAGFKSDEEFSADGQDTEWNAFGDAVAESTSWAAFGEEQCIGACKEEISQCSRTEPASSSNAQLTGWANTTPIQPNEETTRIKNKSPFEEMVSQVSLLNHLERVFQTCFPPVPVIKVTEEEISLRQLLQSGFGKGELVNNGELLSVWTELQDVDDAHGLRYQWGGSHSNKKLLISLGIDTRNILFTGQRKQPVIVPAYASGLGMLEPTKEPVKPISAAEKIASIGQTPTASISPSEMSTSTSHQTQEHVPPVQFDWSSSGLTNPFDANGGSAVLNLDFFGPVDDTSSSNSTTIPGVDPELYELTTSKVEGSGTVNRMTDAFARLMSTAEKTSTSTRKPKKEEVLSEEAAMVIASLPDLSFMHAKVLMFPATLTPLT